MSKLYKETKQRNGEPAFYRMAPEGHWMHDFKNQRGYCPLIGYVFVLGNQVQRMWQPDGQWLPWGTSPEDLML